MQFSDLPPSPAVKGIFAIQEGGSLEVFYSKKIDILLIETSCQFLSHAGLKYEK